MNIYIIFVYMLQHLLFFLLFTKFKNYFLFISLIIYLSIAFIKNDTYDLISYNEVIRNNESDYFEILFYYLILLFNHFINDSRTILYFIQFTLLFGFTYTIYFLKKELNRNIIVFILIVISSVAFNLGIYNNLRQSFASILIILALVSFYRNKYFIFFFLSILAYLFHKSSILFVSYLVIIIMVSRFYFLGREPNFHYKKLNISVIILFSILMALISVYSLFFILEFTSYASYFDRFIDGRILPYYKMLPISFLFIGSELLIGKYNRYEPDLTLIRILRMHTFFSFL